MNGTLRFRWGDGEYVAVLLSPLKDDEPGRLEVIIVSRILKGSLLKDLENVATTDSKQDNFHLNGFDNATNHSVSICQRLKQRQNDQDLPKRKIHEKNGSGNDIGNPGLLIDTILYSEQSIFLVSKWRFYTSI